MISEAKAEIIGLLCAEGNYYNKISSYWQFYKDRNKHYYMNNKRSVYIQFGNFDIRLLKKFQKLLLKEYNYSPKVEKDRVRICKRFIINNLLNYSNYGCLNWKVPFGVMYNRKIIPMFLRGYFEGDGCFCKNKIVFSSCNLRGLKQIKKLLYKLNIKSTIQGPFIRKNKKPSYFVYIKKESWKDFFRIIKPQFKSKPL